MGDMGLATVLIWHSIISVVLLFVLGVFIVRSLFLFTVISLVITESLFIHMAIKYNVTFLYFTIILVFLVHIGYCISARYSYYKIKDEESSKRE